MFSYKLYYKRDFMNYNVIICGAGLAGAAAARLMSEKGKNVLVLEKLPHVGGSVYDEYDAAGILIHKYGPHIFHTNNKDVFDFLSRFTEWLPYYHKVLAKINGEYLPVPFNISALRKTYGEEKAASMLSAMKTEFGTDTVSVMALRDSKNEELKELGEYVYKNIFLYYTMKQWGKSPDEVDPATTARVPVRLSEEDGYFTDKYQGMPKDGYLAMVEKMLDHENIEVRTSCDAKEHIKLEGGKVYFDGEQTDATLIYTGQIDALLDFCYGRLPYRTLDFVFETKAQNEFQPAATVNYTVDEDFTRITEFKKLTLQEKEGVTTIMKEYPRDFEGKPGEIPYYPVANEDSAELYGKYKAMCEEYPNIILLGRLAEYRYYNMDAVVAACIEKLG